MELLALFMAVLAMDRVSKLIITENFGVGESVPLLGNWFSCTFVMNKGAAFGMLEGQRWLFILLAVVVLVGIVYFRKDILKQDVLTQCGVGFFAAGTVGNMIDRFLFGAVIDFIDFKIWPVFNVADMAVCLGVALIFGSVLWTERLQKNS